MITGAQVLSASIAPRTQVPEAARDTLSLHSGNTPPVRARGKQARDEEGSADTLLTAVARGKWAPGVTVVKWLPKGRATLFLVTSTRGKRDEINGGELLHFPSTRGKRSIGNAGGTDEEEVLRTGDGVLEVTVDESTIRTGVGRQGNPPIGTDGTLFPAGADPVPPPTSHFCAFSATWALAASQPLQSLAAWSAPQLAQA
jgi:hypothetical protein